MAGARPRDWWKLPWWWLRLATGAKSFRDNPLLTPLRHVRRMALAHRMTWKRRETLAGAVDPALRAEFDAKGYARWDEALPAAALAEALALIDTALPAREHVQGDTITRRVHLSPGVLAHAPRLAAFLSSRPFRALLDYVGGTRAAPDLYLQTIVTGAVDDVPDPQTVLHSDTFHPTMKAWLFLTEVNADESPLVYVPGSHRLEARRMAWEQAKAEATLASKGPLTLRKWADQRGSFRIDADELGALGLPEPTRFSVPANTLIVADTSGFHGRAPSQKRSVRVEIWAYSRRNPFLPFTGLSPLSLRPIAVRRVRVGQWLFDRLGALGLRKQHWRDVGAKRPRDPQ